MKIRTKNIIPSSKEPCHRSPWRRSRLLILLAFIVTCFPLSQRARAVNPPPDGGYPNFNTAEGDQALFSLTSGQGNTAIGNSALFPNTTGNDNTATGLDALFSNTTGNYNTANGAGALLNNTTGSNNNADGYLALANNTTGAGNAAFGYSSLSNNTTANYNTAAGAFALSNNGTGGDNVALGYGSLYVNTGSNNTGSGYETLFANSGGNNNTASGYNALVANTTGSNNIALGNAAGSKLTTGSNNIDIGNVGVGKEANTIRIGTKGTQKAAFISGISGVAVTGAQPVEVSANGQLGIKASSARFKEAIKPMDKKSEAILALRPVSFRYKKELDPKGVPQFGLVAEEVAKVNPDLVVADDQGKPFTVRYEEVNAMLLNEFLKEHRKVEEQQAAIQRLELKAAEQKSEFQAALAMQQKEQEQAIAVLTKALKEQAGQIQKVSAQVQLNTTAPLVAASTH